MCLVIGPSSIPGWSVANVTSTTMATSGRGANALVREPANVVSSWATASASTSPGGAAGGGDQPRCLGGDVAADAVVERAGDQAAVGKLERVGVDHADVADPDQLPGLLADAAPMSMCRSLSSGAFLRSSSLSRWIGLRAITPAIGAARGC